jgi:hypothetical protein
MRFVQIAQWGLFVAAGTSAVVYAAASFISPRSAKVPFLQRLSAGTTPGASASSSARRPAPT